MLSCLVESGAPAGDYHPQTEVSDLRQPARAASQQPAANQPAGWPVARAAMGPLAGWPRLPGELTSSARPGGWSGWPASLASLAGRPAQPNGRILDGLADAGPRATWRVPSEPRLQRPYGLPLWRPLRTSVEQCRPDRLNPASPQPQFLTPLSHNWCKN